NATGNTSLRSSGADIVVARFTANGSLDSSFNGTGSCYIDIANQDDYGAAVALDGSKIVVVGAAYISTSSRFDTDFAVARLTCGGVLDTSFAHGAGKLATNIATATDGNDTATAVTVLPDHSILVAGAEDFGDGAVVSGLGFLPFGGTQSN